jgi:hypothetical protein
MDGENFFCYNSSKKGKDYIENIIIPELNDKIEVVYLRGKEVESSYPFMSTALYNVKNYQNFPHLMKIRKGEMIDKSINNPFFNVLNLNKPKEELLKQINAFFEIE